MKLVRQSIEFLSMTPEPLMTIEKAARTCYKSEAKVTSSWATNFVRKLLDRGHLAMIEHAWMSYRVVCDRGVSHEIVRHRLFSYAQESTRYCNYKKGGVTFVIPPWIEASIDDEVYLTYVDINREFVAGSQIAKWLTHLLNCENVYINLLAKRNAIDKTNWSPQQARSVLPNALKTEIVISGNLREWLHFFKLRTATTAHPQMREVANMLLVDARERVPVVFEDLSKGE